MKYTEFKHFNVRWNYEFTEWDVYFKDELFGYFDPEDDNLEIEIQNSKLFAGYTDGILLYREVIEELLEITKLKHYEYYHPST